MAGTFTLNEPYTAAASVTGMSAMGPNRESYNWGAALASKKIKITPLTSAKEINEAEACRSLEIFTEV